MKKLLRLFCSFFKRKRNKKKEHTCEELDYPFFSFLISLALIVFFAVQSQAAEIYLFSQHSDLTNSKANEYVDFKSSENILGLGFITHVIDKNKDKLDLRAGLGRSKADISISQTVNLLGKNYTVSKELNYRTGMYLFNISYSYKISQSFSVAAEFEQSKNALKRDTYIFKLSYQF